MSDELTDERNHRRRPAPDCSRPLCGAKPRLACINEPEGVYQTSNVHYHTMSLKKTVLLLDLVKYQVIENLVLCARSGKI